MHDHIIYELPINERIRTLLRLEHLFTRAEHHLAGNTLWDARASINTLIEILCIGGRADLKSELLKALDRQSNNLSKMAGTPGVDENRLQQIISNLENISQKLFSLSGQVGLTLRNNDFIKSIMQRSSIPGGTCDFDLPAYHHWLSQDPQSQKETLGNWFDTFDIVKQATTLILQLIRQSSDATEHLAEHGFYQETMEVNQPAQLIRVGIQQGLMYAEISGGKHRFAIRFLSMTMEGRPTQADVDVPFQLARCFI